MITDQVRQVRRESKKKTLPIIDGEQKLEMSVKLKTDSKMGRELLSVFYQYDNIWATRLWLAKEDVHDSTVQSIAS